MIGILTNLNGFRDATQKRMHNLISALQVTNTKILISKAKSGHLKIIVSKER